MKKLFKEFTAAQLARLRKEYEPLRGKRIPMSLIDKMNTMLSKYSTDMLVKLANTDIPFIATGAKNMAVTKRGKKWSDFKTKLDMSEADELQCEACWDSHKQVGTKISSRTGKRVPNCVPKEELQEVLDMQEAFLPIYKIYYEIGNGKSGVTTVSAPDLRSAEAKVRKMNRPNDIEIGGVEKNGRPISGFKNEIKESSMKRLLQALQDKLSDEGGAAGFDDLKKTAKSMGVNLTPAMLKDIPGIKQHRDGDYILEALDKDDEKSVDDVVKQLKKAVKAHQGQVKTLTKDLKDEADLSKTQVKMVHKKADDMPKKDFRKRYGKDGDSVRYATATNLVKKKLGIGEEELEEAFTKKDFKDNERDNEHGLNATKVVGMFGTSAEKMKIDAINARHNMRGSISREDQRKRDEIVNKYYGKLKEQRALTNPDVATALRQYAAQRPLEFKKSAGNFPYKEGDKKANFDILQDLALKDMKQFNIKFKTWVLRF